MVFMGRGFTSGGQESRSAFSEAVCKIQASKRYIKSLPLVMTDKRTWFSQGERSTVQLPLDRAFAFGNHLYMVFHFLSVPHNDQILYTKSKVYRPCVICHMHQLSHTDIYLYLLCLCVTACLDIGAPLVSPGPQDISTGDLVRVELEADIFKAMQEGHGGWSDPMLEVSGRHM